MQDSGFASITQTQGRSSFEFRFSLNWCHKLFCVTRQNQGVLWSKIVRGCDLSAQKRFLVVRRFSGCDHSEQNGFVLWPRITQDSTVCRLHSACGPVHARSKLWPSGSCGAPFFVASFVCSLALLYWNRQQLGACHQALCVAPTSFHCFSALPGLACGSRRLIKSCLEFELFVGPADFLDRSACQLPHQLPRRRLGQPPRQLPQ